MQSVHLSPLLVFLQEKILNHLSTLRRDRDKIQGCQAKGEADVLAVLVSAAVKGSLRTGGPKQELLSSQACGGRHGHRDWQRETGLWATPCQSELAGFVSSSDT